MIAAAKELQQVPIAEIQPHPDNPRRVLGDLTGLAASMASVGILQPLIVHENGDGVTALLGHRRLAAAALIGLGEVPAFVWTGLSEEEQLEVLLIENLQRDDLKPCEEARAFEGLLRGGKSQRVVAERVGCDQSHVSRRLELLKLSEEDQERVDAGKLTVGKALKSLKPPKEKTPKVVVAEALKPDPIDALEPIGYKVIEISPTGEYVDEIDTIFATPDEAHEMAAFPNELPLVACALVLLPRQISPPNANEGERPADPVVALPPERTGPLVTISAAMGQYNQHIVRCEQHGRLGGFQEVDAANTAAERHADLMHPGEEGVIGQPPSEVVDAEPDDARKAALVEFATTWAQTAADETTVRESAEHEFGELSPDANRAVNLWISAREKLTQKAAS